MYSSVIAFPRNKKLELTSKRRQHIIEVHIRPDIVVITPDTLVTGQPLVHEVLDSLILGYFSEVRGSVEGVPGHRQFLFKKDLSFARVENEVSFWCAMAKKGSGF